MLDVGRLCRSRERRSRCLDTGPSPASRTRDNALALGDNWSYITVEQIAPVASSTHQVAILAGAGTCPREDGCGPRMWARDTHTLASGTPAERAAVLALIRGAMSYRDQLVVDFDSDAFDLSAARGRMHTALASSDSVSAGAKPMVYALHPDVLDAHPRGFPDVLKRGQVLQWDRDGAAEPSRFMEDVTTTRRNKKAVLLCLEAWCAGVPDAARLCAVERHVNGRIERMDIASNARQPSSIPVL